MGPAPSCPPGTGPWSPRLPPGPAGSPWTPTPRASSPSPTPCWTPASPPGTPKSSRTPCGPITYIRWLYAGRQIKGWTGPGTKTTTIDGGTWIPYQEANIVTPPFGEYTSGHSAFSGAAQRVFNLVAGSDSFKVPLSVTITKGRSTIEPGLVPAKNTTLTFKSFTDAANSAGMSRRYGGIHFEAGDLNGRTLGSQIGNQAWTKAQTYFNGTAT